MNYFTLSYRPQYEYYAKDLFGRPIRCFEITADRRIRIMYWNDQTIATTFLIAIANLQAWVDENVR